MAPLCLSPMYAHHFGLTQDPFSIAPDPRYLFMSERHREALAHLLYGVTGPEGTAGGAGGGFVLLTGDIGTGKTTVCRCFLEQIPPGCHVAYIFNPKLSVTELLQSICDEFGIAVEPGAAGTPTVKDFIDALNAFLLQSHAAGQSCVLIIDEAQNLAPDVLEQLRLLTNLETSERKLLQIVLIGQPELRTMLARPELEQLAQRVIARFHLDALTAPESRQYIQHRLAVAGHTGPLPFDAAALKHIHRLARGVPRRINLLCGRALLGAWATGLHQVNRKIVEKASTEVFGPAIDHAPNHPGRPARWTLGGLVLFAGGLVAGGLLWHLRPQNGMPDNVPSPAPVAAAKAAVSAPAMPPPPPATRADADQGIVLNEAPLDAGLLQQMPRDLDSAWRALGTRWRLPQTDAAPCQAALTQQVQCYSAGNVSLPLIRQLARPGILTLRQGDGPPVYALLTGLQDHHATLHVGDQDVHVSLLALGRLWRGDFATYWRPPPNYTENLRDGSSGAAVDWLASRLSRLDGTPAPPATTPTVLDAALKTRIQTFQRSQGFRADGRPGPMTLMQLSRVTGGNEPRLQTLQR